MITEYLMSWGAGAFSWLLGFLPDMTHAEGVVVTAQNSLTSIVAGVASLGVWVPFPVIAMCLGIAATTYVSMLIFKIARVIFAHFPVIGGSG